MSNSCQLSCVLFDLDGTLVDTAPDLIACLNRAFSRYGLPAANTESVKPFISYGAAVMIDESLKHSENQYPRAQILETMLDFYQSHIAEQTVFFEGIADTLNAIEAQGLKWGVVTNKRERFTKPLMKALNLDDRAACVVSGDSTAYSKPHPEPLLTACKLAAVNPKECVFIGDALYDIEAGKNAHMKTLAAVYGYLHPGDRPEAWGADALVETPGQITDWINSKLCH